MVDVPWLIIRTDLAKEAYVSHAIARMGYDSWLPLIATSARICRKSKKRKLDTRPLLPKTLFAAIPEAIHGDLHRIRHYDCIQRDTASVPFKIPAMQIATFRDYLDMVNRDAERQTWLANRVKVKAKVFKLEPGNVAAVLNELFGMREDVAA